MAKVLHIITRLDRGGSAEAVMRLAEGLKRDGYSVKLVTGLTLEPQEDIDEFSARTGVPVVRIEELRREVSPINDLKALIKL
ncbi:MAG: glycosyltransferase family 1 protein, partial [Candidatus Latescibacterota bacterium]